MNDNEAIMDIVAMLRANARGDRFDGFSFTSLADRLEAAHKRDTKELRVEVERLKEERNYSGVRERERLRAKGFAIIPKEQLKRGNAAKLREALEKIRVIAKTFMDATQMRRATDSARIDIGDIKYLADAALATLAAPPRNCDVPEVAKDPWRAWLDDKSNWDEFGSPKLEIHDWLLAPATEKEGGSNANE